MTIQRDSLSTLYLTSDLALAAALSLFFPLETIDKHNPHKAEFVFKRDIQLDQLIEAYWRGEMRVSPQAYFYQLKLIKTRLYEDR